MKTKILPVNYTDDLEKTARDEKIDAIGIEQMSITYIQPADTCSNSDEIQTITITTQCGESVGIGKESYYFNISIPEGEHWSVYGGDSLMALIEDFKKRLYQTNTITPTTKK